MDQNQKTTPNTTPAVILTQTSDISPFQDLFKTSLNDYRQHFWKYLSISVMPLLLTLPLALVVFVAQSYLNTKTDTNVIVIIGLSILIILLITAFFLAAIVSQIALILAIKEPEKSIKTLILDAKPLIKKYFSTSLLSGLVVSGLTLLFIVPGVIMGLYFSLASYIIIYEGEYNWRALQRSRYLLTGFVFTVFKRLLGIIIIVILISMALAGLDKAIFGEQEILSSLTQLIITPFMAIFMVKIYRELVTIKKDGYTAFSDKDKKIFYILLALMVVIVSAIILL